MIGLLIGTSLDMSSLSSCAAQDRMDTFQQCHTAKEQKEFIRHIRRDISRQSHYLCKNGDTENLQKLNEIVPFFPLYTSNPELTQSKVRHALQIYHDVSNETPDLVDTHE